MVRLLLFSIRLPPLELSLSRWSSLVQQSLSLSHTLTHTHTHTFTMPAYLDFPFALAFAMSIVVCIDFM